MYRDFAFAIVGKGVFERIRNQIVEHQITGDGLVEVEQNVPDFDLRRDVLRVDFIGFEKVGDQGGDIIGEIYPS